MKETKINLPNETEKLAGEARAILHVRRAKLSNEDKQPWIFRYRDQITLVFCLTVALVSIGSYLFWTTRVNNQQIEVSRMTRNQAQLQIDINSAPWTELALLPGIGEEKARRIINYRQQQGRITDFNDLMSVEGIGPKTLDSLRPFLVPLPDSQTTAQR